MAQQSQKIGVRSDAQKRDRARDDYDPLPASNPVPGAFGEHKRDTPTDQETALHHYQEEKDEQD